MNSSSPTRGLRAPLLNSDGSDVAPAAHAKYLSALDSSPRGGGDKQPMIIDSRAKQALEALARGPPLKQKRRNRTVPRSAVRGPGTGTIFAAALGEGIDIALIERKWQEKMEDGWSNQILLSDNLIESTTSIEKQVSYWRIFDGIDCFVFGFGCIVCWDVTEQQLELLEQRIHDFVEKPVKDIKRDKVVYTSAAQRVFEHEQELAMTDRAGASADGDGGPDQGTLNPDPFKLSPHIVYGNIQLTSTNSLEKLSYSYAIAQSVRLDVFEDDVADAIIATSQIPVHLAKSGTVGLSNREISVRMGQLFLQRSNVNLHWDILDTPELFWVFDEYEQMYILGRQYLDIDKRIDVLNQRLEIMRDLFEMLQNESNVKHAAQMEVIVIVLILVEVILQVLGIVVSWLTGKAIER